MPRVLIPLAQGVEEMEAVIVTDTLRRAGWTVVLAGLEPGNITASRDVVLLPDTTWDQSDPQAFDLIVLPGGAGGAKRLKADQRVIDALQLFARSGKWIAAICAAPSVLHAAGILAGRNATCYPGWEEGLAGTNWINDEVVVDNRIVTSRGPGTAFAFALTLIRLIDGETAADQVGSGMLVTR